MKTNIIGTTFIISIFINTAIFGACIEGVDMNGNNIKNLNTKTGKEVKIFTSKTDNTEEHAVSAKEVQNYIDDLIAEKKLIGIPTDGPAGGYYDIGGKRWARENTRISKYISDDTDISHPFSSSSADTFSYPETYTGSNVESLPPMARNNDYWGYLYQWDAANYTSSGNAAKQKQGVCPNGWHIPTFDEMATFFKALDPSVDTTKVAGRWTGTNGASNIRYGDAKGSSIVFAGMRNHEGKFSLRGKNEGYWTSDESDTNTAWFWAMDINEPNFYKGIAPKTRALSVRCLED